MTPLLLLAGAVLAFAPQAPDSQAAPGQDAAPWFEKMAALAGKPVDGDLAIEAKTPMGAMKATGHLLVADQEHFRMELEIEMDGKAMGMQEPMHIRQTVQADGRTLWMLMDNPGMGGTQVMKLDLAQARKLGDKMAVGMPGINPQGGQLDLASQIAHLRGLADFQVASQDEKTVVLSGVLNAEGAKTFQMGGLDADLLKITLDRGTGFPVGMELGTEHETAMAMRMENVKFPKKVDLKQFAFTPPEGVQVIDLGPLMGGADAGESDQDF